MRRSNFIQGFILLGGYILCFEAVRLIVLTIVTSLYVSSSDAMQRVDTIIRANQVFIYGFAAALFLIITKILQPLTYPHVHDILQLKALHKSSFVWLNGLILGLVYVVGTTVGGFLNYLGFYIHFNEFVFSTTIMILLGFSFFTLILLEEYLLRKKIELQIETFFNNKYRKYYALLISSALFLIIKSLQFNLTWLEFINFFLLNYLLSKMSKKYSFHHSALFCSVLFFLLHGVLGLPFLGEDMPGIFLFRILDDNTLAFWLAGGQRGPLAGLIMSLLFIVYARLILRK